MDFENADSFIPAIEADDAPSDYGDDGSVASSSQTLSESILEHVYENGRRYHTKSAGKYAMPSDETEQDRLDMVHHFMLLTLRGKLCLTEFENDPHNVLDCGTGTGVWALDFGEHHPGSQVIGTDLAPIQPAWAFPNVKFELDDLEKEWTWKKNFFDFIHVRMIGTGIRNWPRLINQMFEHTTPGGRIELAEHTVDYPYCDDESLPEDSPLHRYYQALATALENNGVNPRLTYKDYKEMLENAGYIDVKVHKFKLPWGRWPKNKESKHQGAVAVEILRSGLEAYGLALMTQTMPHGEATQLIKECFEAVDSGKYHVYVWHWVLTARKPE